VSEPERPEAAEKERALPDGKGLTAMALGLLVPGAGHLMLGRRGRAAVFCAVVFLSLGVGLALDGRLYRFVPDQPLSRLATLGSMGMGAAYFVLRYGAGYVGTVGAPGYEYGTAFILTAGLMNLLLVLDVWDIARGRKP
jgi:hypothetical protein